jgi:hypothetical protein
MLKSGAGFTVRRFSAWTLPPLGLLARQSLGGIRSRAPASDFFHQRIHEDSARDQPRSGTVHPSEKLPAGLIHARDVFEVDLDLPARSLGRLPSVFQLSDPGADDLPGGFNAAGLLILANRDS